MNTALVVVKKGVKVTQGLLAARKKLEAMREAGISPERLDPLAMLKRDPLSLRKAITGFCVQCQGGIDVPNFRSEIRDCTSKQCALYSVRPYQSTTRGI